ncbi:hypothetical protein ACFXO9_31100 [Nocardia tengchongensis]|uniref:hypothetical protein n=1 Tax=Nocardia tengchongensis TaxID=2055889 RepID=UPI003676DE09
MTAEILQREVVNSHAASAPVVFDTPQCIEFWAMAWSKHTAADPQPTGYLFWVTSTGSWHYITKGSAIDCTAFEVPANVAAQLKGCR